MAMIDKFEVQLCLPATLAEAKLLLHRPGWYVVEEKYDGVRAYIRDGKIFNRRGKEITKQFPEFIGLEMIHGDVFDGEIVADTLRFEDIASRVHLKDSFLIKLAAKQNPATFVCFDCVDTDTFLSHEVMGLMGLQQRRERLEQQDFPAILPWFKIAPQFLATPEKLDEMWADVLQNGKEGLVLKGLRLPYMFGRRSWRKVKAWQETQATFTTYEVHPKGITMETVDGRRVVVNGAQAAVVKQKIDADGSVIAEIQFLPQENSDAWRFPSFRGVIR